MKGRNPPREPQMEPKDDLPEIEVEDVIAPILRWPIERNSLANIINNRARRLWHVNGHAQETNAAIQELMNTLGSFKRIEND